MTYKIYNREIIYNRKNFEIMKSKYNRIINKFNNYNLIPCKYFQTLECDITCKHVKWKSILSTIQPLLKNTH